MNDTKNLNKQVYHQRIRLHIFLDLMVPYSFTRVTFFTNILVNLIIKVSFFVSNPVINEFIGRLRSNKPNKSLSNHFCYSKVLSAYYL